MSRPELTSREDRADLADIVEKVVSEQLQASDADDDGRSWALAGELGWLGLEIPEELGGSGASFAELAVVLEHLGGVVDRGPVLSTTVLGAGAILLAGSDEQQRDLLPRIAAGSLRVTAAITAADGALSGPPAALVTEGGALRLSGRSGYVLDASGAEAIVVAAGDGEGITFVLVDAHADGVVIEPLRTMDVTRRLAHVQLDDVVVDPKDVLGSRGEGAPALRRLSDRAALGLAADAVGGMSAALALTVAYVKEREQFGRVVGSFQAVKHHCADMLALTEMSKVAVTRAAEALAREDADASRWCSIAKSYVCEAYVDVTRLATQCHGGVGFTWEFDVHLYLKRARLNQQLLGSTAHHRAAIADSVARTSPGTHDATGVDDGV